MAVQNSLVNRNSDKEITYTAGSETVRLTPGMVKKFLVSGDASRVTDQEIVMFLNLCKFQHLNPFLREAYLVKYGNEPATIVTGKDAFAKRAQRNERYKGVQAGVIVCNSGGETENRIGSLTLPGEALVGGWSKVYVQGYEVPIEITVSLEEYIGRKKDGEVNRQWKSKPATMIRKVAYVQALREAFPEDFAGMYDADEMGLDSMALSDTPVPVPEQFDDDIPEFLQEPDPFE